MNALDQIKKYQHAEACARSLGFLHHVRYYQARIRALTISLNIELDDILNKMEASNDLNEAYTYALQRFGYCRSLRNRKYKS